MSRTIEKVIVKDGCEKSCSVADFCIYGHFNSGDIAEAVFQGTYEECQTKAKKLLNLAGIKDIYMENCYYSGGEASEHTYIHETGYLVKGNQKGNTFCFIAKVNTETFISYVTEEVSTEEIIEKDKKTFRSSMISRAINKSLYKR